MRQTRRDVTCICTGLVLIYRANVYDKDSRLDRTGDMHALSASYPRRGL